MYIRSPKTDELSSATSCATQVVGVVVVEKVVGKGCSFTVPALLPPTTSAPTLLTDAPSDLHLHLLPDPKRTNVMSHWSFRKGQGVGLWLQGRSRSPDHSSS